MKQNDLSPVLLLNKIKPLGLMNPWFSFRLHTQTRCWKKQQPGKANQYSQTCPTKACFLRGLHRKRSSWARTEMPGDHPGAAVHHREAAETTWEPRPRPHGNQDRDHSGAGLLLTGHKEETHTNHNLGWGETCDNMVMELGLDPFQEVMSLPHHQTITVCVVSVETI